jgi:hypothetical protein
LCECARFSKRAFIFVEMQVDARKQLAAMAKDNSAGRMARATAQELSLEDDLKDTLVEVQELEAKTQRDGGSESPRLAAQLDKASENAARLREEVGKLAARNRKLAEAVEERREVHIRFFNCCMAFTNTPELLPLLLLHPCSSPRPFKYVSDLHTHSVRFRSIDHCSSHLRRRRALESGLAAGCQRRGKD